MVWGGGSVVVLGGGGWECRWFGGGGSESVGACLCYTNLSMILFFIVN